MLYFCYTATDREEPMAQQTNAKLPDKTRKQIASICERTGMTITQVLIVAIDRMSREGANTPEHDPWQAIGRPLGSPLPAEVEPQQQWCYGTDPVRFDG